MRSSVLALSLALATPAAAGVVERILAVVEGAPILLSEVELVERLRGVERKAALEAVIDERLMYRDASRLAETALSAEEEERAFQGLRAITGDDAFGQAELRRLARRQAAILRYIEFRFGAQVRIDDEAVRKEWEAQRPEGAAAMRDEDADRIRQRLAAKELDERIEAWVRELRAAADVRYNP
jgi:hypothetical protein